jgi:ribosome-interacting GTPase 1
MQFISNRINEINDWRAEAVKHAVTQEQLNAIEARVLKLREELESRLTRG